MMTASTVEPNSRNKFCGEYSSPLLGFSSHMGYYNTVRNFCGKELL